MLTLGIDLASQPSNTAACLVRWSPGRAVVERAQAGLDDASLLALAAESDVCGIDAPFGWPDAFARNLGAHHSGAPWPTRWSKPAYGELCYRRTDHHVIETAQVRPLSVSADRIGIAAMRCAWLLGELGVRDRSGDGRVFEVYPAAALSVWRLRGKASYKGKDAVGELLQMMERLLAAAPWLTFGESAPRASFVSDHLFDALVGALCVRAAALGRTHRPPPEEQDAARREGWIALPEEGALEGLA